MDRPAKCSGDLQIAVLTEMHSPSAIWRSLLRRTFVIFLLFAAPFSQAEDFPLSFKTHCFDCHNDEKAKGKFNLKDLGTGPTEANLDRWLDVLDLVKAEEMPPEDESELEADARREMIAFVESKLKAHKSSKQITRSKVRRMNNREFENSVRDALLLEDIGTHFPTADLIGDSLHHGFDTHGETLGFSRFHLEQYINAVRQIVDATILSGERPEPKTHKISPDRIMREETGQNTSRPIRYGKDGYYDIADPNRAALFADFPSTKETGRYRITIEATGKDRMEYQTKHTGYYNDDPIQLAVHMGDRVKTFTLPDEEKIEIQLDEWLAAGTYLELRHPTDAFRMRGNGNFKFQNTIAALHHKEFHPAIYNQVVEKSRIADLKKRGKERNPDTWHNWTEYWEGARPRIFGVTVEGPFYDSWPPERQIALLGENPSVEKAREILRPIAERAWRKSIESSELDPVIELVERKVDSLGEIEALKEGIVSILVSPSFLMLNREQLNAVDHFAEKFSYFLQGTLPSSQLRQSIQDGDMADFEALSNQLKKQINSQQADEFLREFPFAWLELNDINFMSPDPQRYTFYHKKEVSEDMVDEVLHFFRHIAENNLPVTELLSANYSFVNADLAGIYGLEDVPADSQFRKYTFTDGRRGGLLGMGAFLTATADSLATSPIHRAVYVMENFMGIHPTPPPPDVEISEPDVRQAKTIKEILAAHTSDETCASCHKSIDPWGYAFENFDPTGAWRDVYVNPLSMDTGEGTSKRAQRKMEDIPIDASASFRNGKAYNDITEFRDQILTDANRDRFVRCFISKLLTYANGEEPGDSDYAEIDQILQKSAEHDYRMIETIAAVVDSPLFRGE